MSVRLDNLNSPPSYAVGIELATIKVVVAACGSQSVDLPAKLSSAPSIPPASHFPGHTYFGLQLCAELRIHCKHSGANQNSQFWKVLRGLERSCRSPISVVVSKLAPKYTSAKIERHLIVLGTHQEEILANLDTTELEARCST